MLTSDFDYDLPADLIAQEAAPRGTSRLLVPEARGRIHRSVAELPELLSPGDLLVVNNTRVIPARLFARRLSGGGRVELLLIRKTSSRHWLALAKPGRKARPGTELDLGAGVRARVLDRPASGQFSLRFSEPIEPHLGRLGHVPLPPYIRRQDQPADRERYQTVYASRDGAIAAPTAGLHLTEALLKALRAGGVEMAELTLHVGIGTFKPVTAALVHEHQMEAESFDVGAAAAAAIERTRASGGNIVAVGTTVVRTLESVACRTGGRIEAMAGETELFIVPGFRFQVVDRLLTNFHLPRSTLLMLVSAFAGKPRVLEAYQRAVRERYRFYSYGDAMLLDRAP